MKKTIQVFVIVISTFFFCSMGVVVNAQEEYQPMRWVERPWLDEVTLGETLTFEFTGGKAPYTWNLRPSYVYQTQVFSAVNTGTPTSDYKREVKIDSCDLPSERGFRVVSVTDAENNKLTTAVACGTRSRNIGAPTSMSISFMSPPQLTGIDTGGVRELGSKLVYNDNFDRFIFVDDSFSNPETTFKWKIIEGEENVYLEHNNGPIAAIRAKKTCQERNGAHYAIIQVKDSKGQVYRDMVTHEDGEWKKDSIFNCSIPDASPLMRIRRLMYPSGDPSQIAPFNFAVSGSNLVRESVSDPWVYQESGKTCTGFEGGAPCLKYQCEYYNEEADRERIYNKFFDYDKAIIWSRNKKLAYPHEPIAEKPFESGCCNDENNLKVDNQESFYFRCKGGPCQDIPSPTITRENLFYNEDQETIGINFEYKEGRAYKIIVKDSSGNEILKTNSSNGYYNFPIPPACQPTKYDEELGITFEDKCPSFSISVQDEECPANKDTVIFKYGCTNEGEAGVARQCICWDDSSLDQSLSVREKKGIFNNIFASGPASWDNYTKYCKLIIKDEVQKNICKDGDYIWQPKQIDPEADNCTCIITTVLSNTKIEDFKEVSVVPNDLEGLYKIYGRDLPGETRTRNSKWYGSNIGTYFMDCLARSSFVNEDGPLTKDFFDKISSFEGNELEVAEQVFNEVHRSIKYYNHLERACYTYFSSNSEQALTSEAATCYGQAALLVEGLKKHGIKAELVSGLAHTWVNITLKNGLTFDVDPFAQKKFTPMKSYKRYIPKSSQSNFKCLNPDVF